jgi:C4-dicarboxylate transporter DctM subunit
VLLIVGTSTLFGKILTFEEAAPAPGHGVLSFSKDPYVVMLLIIGVLIILGMFMETLSTIIILCQCFMPMLNMVASTPSTSASFSW